MSLLTDAGPGEGTRLPGGPLHGTDGRPGGLPPGVRVIAGPGARPGAPGAAGEASAAAPLHDGRSAFKRAQAAAEEAETGAPAKVVTLPPGAWATTYPERPGGDVLIGLRRYAEAEAVQARAAASGRAWRLHPQEADEAERVIAGDGALMAWLVARGTCQPEDRSAPYFGVTGPDGVRMPSDDVVQIALTPKGIEFLFNALQTLLVEESPTTPQADDDALVQLADVLTAPETIVALGPHAERRVRRLAGAILEILEGEGR